MITITINKKKFKGVYLWEDMTLHQFCDLAAIPMPEGYEAFIIADGKFSVETIDQYIEDVSKVTDEQLKVNFPAYYRKVIGVLTNIPDKVKLTTDQVDELYEFYFKPFVLSLIYHTPVIYFMGQLMNYQPVMVKKFRIGRHVFRVPEMVRALDQNIPLAKEPVVTYIEASDQFRGMKVTKDDVRRLAIFMAIYCRKRFEIYKEERTIRREHLFFKARMSVVWSVFFYTLRRLPLSVPGTLLFGSLPRTTLETVSVVRDFKTLVHADLSTN
jgi:hypothetical protein